MKIENKIHFKYDRINSRYNRLWEQITSFGIFILATISAYLIALGTIEKDVPTILSLTQINYILLFLGIILALAYGILCTYLVMTRKELTKLFNEHELD